MKRPISRNSRSVSRAVSFRLPDSYYDRLAEEAARFNLSAGEYARQIVVHGLGECSNEFLSEELAAVQAAIATLHEHLAAATIVLLHDAGKADVKDAAGWVHANLIPESLTRSYPNSRE